MVQRRSLTGELSLSCARPAADGWPLMWVNHPLQVSQLGQLSLSSLLAQSNGSILPGLWRDSLHVTCRLTVCTPGSARGPTLGNEYGKTLPLPLVLNREEPTTLHWTKQSTWPRIVLCGGWCLHTALHTASGACQKRRRLEQQVNQEPNFRNFS